MDNNIPRIIPPVYFLLAVVVMILLSAYAPINRWLQFPWRYVGVLVIGLGFVLILVSGNLFRKLGTPRRPGLQATTLVTTGAFRFTRNPMYLGMIIILIGVAILLGSVSPAIVIPFIVWILHTQFILREEKWMEGWFGDSYVEYKKKTPRWF